jgi:EAL domain-containing protein (putative c-di-GMP-specific phosphodiesterase class I)
MARFDFPFASKASGANAAAGNAVSAPAQARRFNTDDVSKQLLRVLQPLHVDSLSLHDAAGELQWLNDGAFAPDEHGVVTDALDVFALDPSREDLQLRLDDDRSALVACARDAKGELLGIALVIVETPSMEESSAKLSSPRLVAQMRRLAQLLAPQPAIPPVAAPATAKVAAPTAGQRAAPMAAPGSSTAAAAAVARPASKAPPAAEEFFIGDDPPRSESSKKSPPTAPKASDELDFIPEPAPRARPKAVTQSHAQMQSLEFGGELTLSDEPSHVDEAIHIEAISLEGDQVETQHIESGRVEPALAQPLIIERRARPAGEKPAVSADTIHAHRYARLRAGGAARRYEVKAAPDASFTADLLLAKHVVKHLQRSGDRYTQTPASFAVPLSVQSVIQDGWVSQLQPRLTRAGLPEGLIGFCLPAAAWQQQHDATVRFIAQCEQARCFVALDDFTLGDSGLALLRSSAVKCLKIDGQLIASVVQDKFAHATLAAIVQAARVLGLYCVAKKVSSSSQVKWLAGAGIEFADGISRGVAAAATRNDEALTLQSE